MPNILITGCSKGLGFEFTKQYLEKGSSVFGVSRNPKNFTELYRLGAQYQDQLVLFPVDVSDESTPQDLAKMICSYTDTIDIVINNAGILSANEENCAQLGDLDQDDLLKTFHTNAIAPLLITQSLSPLMSGSVRPVVVNISSLNGSITNREQGGKYSYCASKAALNMITKILAQDLKPSGIIVVSMHPGWVKTWMTRNEQAPLEPVDSVTGMIQVLESLELEDTGRFLDWKGQEIAW